MQHETKRARPGRPPLPGGEKQAHRVMVNLTAAEHRALAKAAGGEPLGGFVRRVLLRMLSRRP